MRKLLLTALAIMATNGGAPLAIADDVASPLEPLARLTGGRWRLGESVQEYAWDMGRRRVTGRAYVTSAEGERLVSSGAWYYHPGKGAIVGYFVARDMGIELLEYITRFEGDVMINEVVGWSAAGQASRYEERWRFTGPDSYLWELYESGDKGPKKVMEGVFERVD
jgi:hypothetical protein